DRSSLWNECHKMVIEPRKPTRVSTAASRFTNNGRSLKILQIVGEFLRSGECAVTGKHIDVFVQKLLSGNGWRRPEFLGPVVFSPIEIVEMNRLVTEEV